MFMFNLKYFNISLGPRYKVKRQPSKVSKNCTTSKDYHTLYYY